MGEPVTRFKYLGQRIGHDGVDEIFFGDGYRKVTVLCLQEKSTIDFCYYRVGPWDYPFQDDPYTEEDRAQVVEGIIQHYQNLGWDIEMERRRFCGRCHELLPGSDCPDWEGGRCGFCGRRVDRFGNSIRPET